MIPAWLGRLLRTVRAGDRRSLANHPVLHGVPENLILRSDWFANGAPMPLRAAGIGVGDNISPPLNWKHLGRDAIEIAIVMEDPDVPLPKPFVHMIVCHISPHLTRLDERALAQEASGLFFGKNTAGSQGYMGPRPVPGHGPHRYIFYILALNRRSEFSVAPKLNEFLETIKGTVVGYGRLVGTYERS